MRVRPHDMATLRGRIAPLDCEANRSAYRTGNFPNAHRVTDLDKRYRWDLFWAVHGTTWIAGLTYDVNDAHIDTALARIVPSLFGSKVSS